jgi:hypothetical protein
MKKLSKLVKFVFLVAFVLGGWALAAASLHVVRAPGSMIWNKVPLNVQLVPKNTLTFHNTFIDTTKWTVADVDAHPDFVQRLKESNKLGLIEQAEKTPAPAQATASAAPVPSPIDKPAVEQPVQAEPAAPAKTEEKPRPKSIFDFDKK